MKGEMEDSEFPTGDQNFEFAFNSSNFSDRVLRIEILAGPSESKGDGVGGCDACCTIAEWRNRKRRREDGRKDRESAVCKVKEENILDCNQPDLVDEPAFGCNEEEAEAMMEEPSVGNEAANINELPWSIDQPTVLRVKTIFISSAILAAKSPFFYKLFSNGMMESDQRHATLRINESEEAALMDLLSYIYSGKLTTVSATGLLDVLMAADKFEVSSCMRHCSQLLRNLPMTPESALLYLELPCSVSMASAVMPLTDAAKEYLASRYKDISKFPEEVMNLPLSGIEAVLSSDDLQVASEDALYDFVLKWVRNQYPKVEDRREIFGTRLCRLIRFPFMTCRRLRKVLVCSDLDHDVSSKMVLEALFFKGDTPHRQRAIAHEETQSRQYIERAYKYRPVKVVEFEKPYKQCIVYLDLKKDECIALFPHYRVYSQAFHLGGQGFFLSAHCNLDTQNSFPCFGLFLGMQDKGAVFLTVDYEFAARARPSGEFVSKYKGYYTFTGGKAVGYRNLFAIPWTSFIADDSLYFIDGTLHLRAELTIKQQPATGAP